MTLPIEETVHELEHLDPQGPGVLSLYLVTDLSTAPGRNLDAQFTDATRPLADRIADKEELKEFGRNRDAAWQAVTKLASPPRSIAIFSSASRSLFRSLELRLPLSTSATWNHAPYLRPLLTALDEHERTVVVFIDKQHARLFRVLLGDVEEIQALEDAVPRKHDQGGWAQAQLQRHHEMHVLQHVRRAVEVLRRITERERVDRILVTGPTEAITEFERHLPKPLHARVTMAELPLDAYTTPTDVQKAVESFSPHAERTDEQQLMTQLVEQRGTGQAVFGIAEVTKVILEQRAALLAFTARARFFRRALSPLHVHDSGPAAAGLSALRKCAST